MISNCPVCITIPKNKITAKPKTLRYLKYKIYAGNIKEILDGMYSKDPRPNLHIELGYSDSPDSPDRFYADDYDQLIKDIANMQLEYPPDVEDI